LKGLALSVNYTVLQTHGDFGGKTYLGTGQIPGFIPKTGNVSLSWRHRGFGARVLVNFTGDYISSYNATAPGRAQYRFKRTVVDVGVSYQFTAKVGVSLDVSNLFNERLAWYQAFPDRLQRSHILGTTVNLGLTGRF
jgi:outer membrane receptor protein involved in Fe transport